jgi:transcriptional regulator with XRE-family HTH domain
VVATRETRVDRGRSHARQLTARLLGDLLLARRNAGVSQRALARLLKWPQSRFSEFERNLRDPTIGEICEVGALLGLKPTIQLHSDGEPLRDRGQLKLIGRFRSLLSQAWHVRMEAPFPTLGDLRSWDVLIRLGSAYRVGVEAETRVRDNQELVRRIRQRELHGGVDEILVILSDSAHNRRVVGELREALGERYATPQRQLVEALRGGRPLPGSGVILL